MTKQNSKQIRVSLVFLIYLVLALIFTILPGGGEFYLTFLFIILLIKFNKEGILKKFDLLDAILIVVFTIFGILSLIYLGILSLIHIPWWKIIVIGIAADVISMISASVPVLGDFVGGFLVFLVTFGLIDGIHGVFIGATLMIISFLPAHIPGSQTGFMVMIKLISPMVIGG